MTEETKNNQVIGIVAQYLKDISFENVTTISDAGAFDEEPEIDLQLKVNAQNAKDERIFKVSVIANVQAKLKNKKLFIMDVEYIGEFVISGFEEKMLEPILYIECPRLLFPFIRSIIANTVGEGGFPALYLSPVNFTELYEQQVVAQNETMQ